MIENWFKNHCLKYQSKKQNANLVDERLKARVQYVSMKNGFYVWRTGAVFEKLVQDLEQ